MSMERSKDVVPFGEDLARTLYDCSTLGIVFKIRDSRRNLSEEREGVADRWKC